MGQAPAMFLMSAVFIFAVFFDARSAAKTFGCRDVATCRALVEYRPSGGNTSLSHILDLFGVKTLRSLLGANDLPLSTPRSFSLPSNRTIRIPIPCGCANGTGVSKGAPLYTVLKGDELYDIATDLFGRLVTFMEIATANGIRGPNRISPGQVLRIPLPCSCDKVNGLDVVHYALSVAPRSSVEEIAAANGVDMATLMRLNGITDPKSLQAYDVLDVPLRACSSRISNQSLDHSLLLPNATYLFTAQNCVKCKCDAANNWRLRCEPSKLEVARNSTWSACPATRCEGSNVIWPGDIALSLPGSCSRSCAYAGYNNQTILLAVTNSSTCSASPPNENRAAALFLHGSDWNFFIFCINLLLLNFPVL